jgi:hypothetical protein
VQTNNNTRAKKKRGERERERQRITILPPVNADSKLLSVFPSICHGNPDNNLESLCIAVTQTTPDNVPRWNFYYSTERLGPNEP